MINLLNLYIKITEPTKSLILVHDESKTYKQLYTNLSQYIKQMKKHESKIEQSLTVFNIFLN